MKLKEIPKECENCLNNKLCLEEGFAKNRIECLARIKKRWAKVSRKITGNKIIEIQEVQEDRIWIHSTYLGYGKWIYNNELEKLIDELSKREKNNMW